jgi:23S rRNA (uracil1939-C5)-methyltransferase
MSGEGRGIAHRGGKIVFVTGALAGEQAQVQCTAVKKDYDEADMITLAADTAPASSRTAAPCPVYERCGGCNLQHWSLAAQQQHKQEILHTLLHHIAPKASLETSLTSEAIGFRHRLRLLVARTADRSYSLGLRQRRSHQSISLQHCLVADSAVNTALQALPVLLSEAPDLQGLREIEIDSDNNGEVGLCFYFAANPGEKILSMLTKIMLAQPSIIAVRMLLRTQRGQVAGNYPDDPDSGALSADWKDLYVEGELCLRPDVPSPPGTPTSNTLQLGYRPGDFTQTNWQVNSALLARALDWLQPRADEIALDLFCGMGNFTLALARHSRQVYALEADQGMTGQLIRNAQRNGIDNIEALVRNLMANDIALPSADIAIIDPPRAGANAVCEALARSRVRRVLYISCHPATLARDARILTDAGFTLSRAAAVDMFPHTGHSEAIALFERR